MSELAVLLPVLDRPHRATPVLKSIRATVPDAAVLFLCSPGDEDEVKAVKLACRAHGGTYTLTEGGYAAKIAAGVEATGEALVFLAADDIEPVPGWFEAACAYLTDQVEVVGVNDLLTRSRVHATHFLMTRAYAERTTIDGQPGPLFQGYSHSFVDDELIATATRRGVYAYAEDAHVRHLHPDGGMAEMDETYRLGRARMYEDRKLFRQRSRLWQA